MTAQALRIAAALLLSLPASAAELRTFELPVELSAGWGGQGGSMMQSQLAATPKLELDLTHSGSLTLSARLRVDAREQLEPGTPPLENYASASQPHTLGSAGTLELRDVYWEQRLASGIARLGKQQIVWGRLDGLKILDVLNPQNFREFILDDFDESRISLWSAYFDFFVGDWRIEAAVLPDFTAHEIPEPGAWYALTAPRFRFGAQPASPAPPTTTETGRNALSDSAVGLRVSRSFGRVDISGLAYSGSDHEPLGRVRIEGEGEGEGESTVLERYYRRRELLGISAETSLGAIALRAEAALQPSRVFNIRNDDGLGTARADQISAGVAVDLDGPLETFLNLQLLWDEVLDAPEALVRPARDRLGTVTLRRGFAYDTARLEARWYHSFDDRDDLYRLAVHYDVNENTTLSIAGDWFEGVSEGLFGQFADRDRVVLSLRRTF